MDRSGDTARVEMMQYNIMLYNKNGEAYNFYDSYLPFYSEALIEGMRAEFCDEVGICKACDVQGRRCHVMISSRDEPDAEEKLCPILFYDAFKPSWKIEDIC